MQADNVNAVLTQLHDAIERHWKKAGSPDHCTEPLLWEMEAHLDNCCDESTPSIQSVFTEGIDLLEEWMDCNLPSRKTAHGEILKNARATLATISSQPAL
jgi:hypothetical protein